MNRSHPEPRQHRQIQPKGNQITPHLLSKIHNHATGGNREKSATIFCTFVLGYTVPAVAKLTTAKAS